MSAYNSKGLSVITVPYKMKQQMLKAKKFEKIKHKENILQQSRKGNTSKPIITCKNSKLNFYQGQTYGKFQTVPLASQGWKGKKSRGDFFTIHKYGQNPAFIDIGNTPINFEDLGLDSRIVEQFRKNGFEKPTNIQSLAIPHILEGSNTLIAAETGNGKTFAFLAPILHQVLNIKENPIGNETPLNSPKVLIIVPGRELVIQTRDMARLIGSDLGININSIVGGRTKRMMLYPRVGEPDILIGTFGALSKLLTSRVYKKNRVNHIVLDEADTLLDDSFNESTKYFISKFSIRGQEESGDITGVQLSLVGATFPRSLKSILDKIIDVDSLVHVKTPHLHRISPHITQTFLRISHAERAERLLKIAKKNQREKIPTIIFSNTSESSDWASLFLNENDIPCTNINGAMRAFRRVGKFQAFQNDECSFISCTDLVSRGLNTIRAKHILNFDFPKFISDYIHRCGRTGRVGSEEDCLVTNFILQDCDIDLVQKIEYAMRKVEDLPNVNANIRRIITARTRNYEENVLREKEEEKEMAEDLSRF